MLYDQTSTSQVTLLRLLADARRCLGAGNPQAARDLLSGPCSDQATADPNLLAFYARVIAQTEDFSRGIAMTEGLVQRFPDRADMRSAHIELLIEGGFHTEAFEAADAACGIFTGAGPSIAFGALAVDALELLNEPAAAEKRLSELLERSPRDPGLLGRRERLVQAANARRRVDESVREVREETGPDAPAIPMDNTFIEAFLDQFAGREGVHALQCRLQKGEWGYRPIRKGLDPDQLKRHLAGDVTLGTYLVRRDNSTRLMVFDLDVTRPFTLRYEKDPLERRRIKRLLMEQADRLYALADSVGLPLLAEFSGFKGLHFWTLYKEPLSCRQVRAVGNWLLERLDAPPRELHWELFPKQARVEPEGLGNLVKIPLGIHGRSGKRSFLLSRGPFRPFPDQAEGFTGFRSLNRASVEELLGRLTIQNVADDARDARSVRENRDVDLPGTTLSLPLPSSLSTPTTGISPASCEDAISLSVRIPLPGRFSDTIENLFSGCRVLWTLAEKASMGEALDRAERHVLVYLLGSLEEEGRITVHQILNQAPGYDANEVNRALRAVPPTTMSCAKVRRNLPDVAEASGCDCQFRIPDGCYPSPLIYAGMIPSGNAVARGRRGFDRSPACLSGREEIIGASAGIDAIMREYANLQADLRRMSDRERLLRRRINRLFEEAGRDVITTGIGEYKKLPPEEGGGDGALPEGSLQSSETINDGAENASPGITTHEEVVSDTGGVGDSEEAPSPRV
ncbi:MAG: hypothetical protein HQM09_08500 [Candidatus Riflebacteria bacterium]|nr:hypothetical protein [Candidatus Riflebacteria bacterium]